MNKLRTPAATSHERLDVPGFVLQYLESQDSLVAPPAFGVYEVIIPDALAAGLGLGTYQRLSFEQTTAEHALAVGVGHPLLEKIAERLVGQPANTQGYLNGVRLDKKGLAALAQKTFTFPNARLTPKPDAAEQAALHHYLRFNFKVMFDSEEKQEQLAAVVMDLQSGCAVRDAEVLARLNTFDAEPAFEDLPVATTRWPGAGKALAADTLRALLPRAEAAMRADMADRLQTLQARTQRYLELDVARIADYYDNLESDLRRRRERLAPEESERQSNVDDKLGALQAERASKLADVAGRYHLRLALELINVLVLVQPKLLTPVEIGNRTATITRVVVWDPLVHRLEPLICDVCGEPGEGLHLCTGGHLAHHGCLAPQCIDCKRVYCRLCQEQMRQCVICARPVCQHSLIICPTCKRGTCREHQNLCHAAAGAPARLPEAAPASPPPPPPLPAPPKPDKSARPARSTADQRRPPLKSSQPPLASGETPITKGVRVNVEIFEERPEVIAYVMRSANRVLAKRTFTLTPEGIAVHCDCEKGTCRADGIIHRPVNAQRITEQINGFLADLRQEYLVPSKHTNYFFALGQRVRESQIFLLPPVWKIEERLREANEGFDALVRRQHRR